MRWYQWKESPCTKLKHTTSLFYFIGSTGPEPVAERSATMDSQPDLQDWYELLKIAREREMPRVDNFDSFF
jgi:hypothetical protein